MLLYGLIIVIEWHLERGKKILADVYNGRTDIGITLCKHTFVFVFCL